MASDPIELLPCPFCGTAAEFETTTDPDGDYNCVCCPDCMFSMMNGDAGIGWHSTEAEAAAAWNRRAEQPAPAAEGGGAVELVVRQACDAFNRYAGMDLPEDSCMYAALAAAYPTLVAERDALRARVAELERAMSAQVPSAAIDVLSSPLRERAERAEADLQRVRSLLDKSRHDQKG